MMFEELEATNFALEGFPREHRNRDQLPLYSRGVPNGIELSMEPGLAKPAPLKKLRMIGSRVSITESTA
ncbi:hypothetical protein EC957_000406 [Mortierella hygrophila]|uniref:Uncharacterized protein n=1 Tax=Mortierella hygrophila TaxID=979708 RepID=A0A9P6K3C4_9FUNG|nr:hypothetical protein EC957_000406 [Mortierella hygrophila]